MQTRKTDNHNLAGKLALRRHFLRRYHAAGETIKVLDCCQASGRIWNELRKEFGCEYWGVDLKPKKGRLKIDSVRILEQPGWPQNVVDVDTYGLPWNHWTALLPNAPAALTVFLTIGMVKVRGGGNLGKAAVAALGIRFERLSAPKSLLVRLTDVATLVCIARARDYGFRIVECREADNAGGNARYIGVRLER